MVHVKFPIRTGPTTACLDSKMTSLKFFFKDMYVYLFRMKQTLNMYELVLKRRQILARYQSETVWNAGVPIFEYFVPQAGKDMSMLWQFYRIRLDCPTMGFDIFCLLNIYCEMLIFCKESWGLSCSLSSFISSHDSSKWIIWCKLRNKLVKKPY